MATQTETTIQQNTTAKIGLFVSIVWTIIWFMATSNATDVVAENWGGALVAIGLIAFVYCLVAIIVTGNSIKRRTLVISEQTKNDDESSTKDCPYCAEPIRAAAIKCKHCGSDLTLAASVDSTLA